MNNRDRFRHVLRFERVDRLPRYEWAAWWDLTVSRWKEEGLPTQWPEGRPGAVAIVEHFGLDPVWVHWFRAEGPDYPRMPRGQGPVADMADYERIRGYLFKEPDWEAAFPAAVRERHARGEMAIRYVLDGFFWFARRLFGIERHLYAFYDQPALMRRMNDDLCEYNKRLLRGIGNIIQPEFMTFAEDLSYNNGPMLSRAHFDEFVAPYYRELTPILRAQDVVPMVDSDGNVELCLPWFTECGVDGLLPFERQSGVDIARVRRNHPQFRMVGGFDKMTMDRGLEAMRAEWERLLPVMRQGGFIPSVDHQTPPGVSLAQYRDYLALLWEYTERGAC